MVGVIRELNDSSDLLQIALDRYLDACGAFRNYFMSGIASRALHLDLLSTRAVNELPFLRSHETKLSRAKSSINAVRNLSFNVVPINSLPSEILTCIFNLVLAAQIDSRKYALRRSTLEFPGYPDTLAQVCSRWRHVALASSSLWSYLDFSPYNVVDKGILCSAERYKSRTNGCPLQLDITGPEASIPDPPRDMNKFLQFLPGIAPQIRALTLMGKFNELHFGPILDCCFSRAVPGVLNQLTIAIYNPLVRFIESVEQPTGTGSVQLGLPKDFLESLWLPITHLMLCGIFPRWSSNAYRGLVELRLFSRTREPPITDVQLIGILEASPGLRVCRSHLALITTDSLIAPVCLRYLEVFALPSVKLNQLGRLLRLISLGTEPLQFHLTLDDSLGSLSGDLDSHIKDFFARAHISKLAINQAPSLSWVRKVYELAPQVQALVLAKCNHPSSDLELENEGNSAMRNSLDHLYLSRCQVDLHWLQSVLKNYPVQKLTLWDCNVAATNGEERSNLHSVLTESCSVVNILEARDLSPLLGWY